MPRVVPPIDGRGNVISPSSVEAMAGVTAGIAATLSVHPLDVLKTRMQLDRKMPSKFGDSYRIFRNIVRDEGSFRALYRGIVPNMIGNSVSWGLYFLWYHQLKDLIKVQRGADQALLSVDYFVASGVSGVLTAICTNPIWVVKTRMLSSGRNAPGAYQSVMHGLTDIYKNEGLKGYYRGFVPSLFGVSQGAIQFMAYERLKQKRAESLGPGKQLSNLDYLTISGTAKIFSGAITYPYQVLRARLQSYDANSVYTSMRDVVRQVWQHEGIRGFYKGIIPNSIRVLPNACVTFLVYENTKYYLPDLFNSPKVDI